MAHTMDTDYDLPIPTHRSCVRDDPQHDKPLPFRYQLQKVTRLTAENSTPFTLPKQRSQLESIPVELRRMIWGFLGLEGNNKPLQSGFGSTDWYGPASTNELFYGHDSAWHPDFTTSDGNEVLVFRKAMAINKNIRSELLDILFEGARVRIRHHLSDRKIFFRCRDAYDKPVLGRMIHACSTFEYLRHVYLGRCYDDYDEAPHSMRVCKTQVRRPIMRRAESIRFIADHCPLLVSLQIVVSPWPRDHRHGCETKRSIRFCELKPIVIALQCVTQKCPSLETLKAVTPIKPCSVPAVGTIYREGHAHEEVRGLDLTKTPIYLREELVEAWANTSMRKVIELGTNDRYLYGRLCGLWRAFSWGPGEGRWQWFRTNVLGEVEFEDVQSVS